MIEKDTKDTETEAGHGAPSAPALRFRDTNIGATPRRYQRAAPVFVISADPRGTMSLFGNLFHSPPIKNVRFYSFHTSKTSGLAGGDPHAPNHPPRFLLSP